MLAAAATLLLRSASTRAASTAAAPRGRALAALRASNASLPSLAGATLLARVLRADRGFVVVDAGLKRPVRVAHAELRADQLVSSPAGASPLRAGPGDVRVGDVLRVHVDAVTTPYGDPALSSGPRADRSRSTAEAWAALEAALASGGTVQGRVLNGIGQGGFSVGVAGLVGFLPHSLTAPATVARVGTLQPFRVVSIDRPARSFILEDVGAAARRAAAEKARKEAEEAGDVDGGRRPAWAGDGGWTPRAGWRDGGEGGGQQQRPWTPRPARQDGGERPYQPRRWAAAQDGEGGERPYHPRRWTAQQDGDTERPHQPRRWTAQQEGDTDRPRRQWVPRTAAPAPADGDAPAQPPRRWTPRPDGTQPQRRWTPRAEGGTQPRRQWVARPQAASDGGDQPQRTWTPRRRWTPRTQQQVGEDGKPQQRRWVQREAPPPEGE